MMTLMVIILSILMATMKHPLSMGITLLSTAIMTSISTMMIMNSPWYPLIFFIIMVGGVLVLFLYMASISPNSMNPTSLIIPIMVSIPLTMGLNQFSPMNQMKMNLSTMKTLLASNNSTLIPLMALYLLLTMVLIIKITNKNKSPLRNMI